MYCPFQSTNDKKVECTNDCALALNYCDRTTCSITLTAINLSNLDRIDDNVKSLADSVYQIKNR